MSHIAASASSYIQGMYGLGILNFIQKQHAAIDSVCFWRSELVSLGALSYSGNNERKNACVKKWKYQEPEWCKKCLLHALLFLGRQM